VTTLGILLDPIADKLLISAAFVSLVEMRLVPGWMVVIIIGGNYRAGIAQHRLRGRIYNRGVGAWQNENGVAGLRSGRVDWYRAPSFASAACPNTTLACGGQRAGLGCTVFQRFWGSWTIASSSVASCG